MRRLFYHARATERSGSTIDSASGHFRAFFSVQRSSRFISRQIEQFDNSGQQLYRAGGAAIFMALLHISSHDAFRQHFRHSQAATNTSVRLARTRLISSTANVRVLIFIG